MRRLLLGVPFLFGAILACSSARADCISALTPTQISQSTDYAFEYSLLKTITSSNYEEHKKNGNAGAQILDIPATASYDQFDSARSYFFSMYDENVRQQIKANYTFNGLTDVGYQAYAECLRQTSNSPLSAWVEKSNKSLIVVKVKSYLPNGYTANLEVNGATPINAVAPFQGTGEQEIVFNRPTDDDFLVALQLKTNGSAPYVGTTVELAKPLNLRKVTDQEVVHAAAHCGAGCHGSTTGCQNVEDVNLSPKAGYSFAKDVNFTKTGDTGIARFSPNAEVAAQSLKTHFLCEADQGNAQKFVTFDVTVTQSRDRIVLN